MRRIVRSGCLWGMLVTVTSAAATLAEEPITLRGQVLLTDGKPAAGAELYWPQAQSPPPKAWGEIRYAKRGASDAAGRFQIELSPGDLPTPELPLYLVAHQAGFGIDWLKAESIGDRHIDPYRRATLSEADRQRVLPMEDGIFTRAGGTIASLDNAAKVVDLAPGSQPTTCDLPVDAGKTLSIAVEDDEGRPVRDAFVSGLAECWPFTFRIAEQTCTIYALGADRPRRICILHPERGLAASLTLTGDEQGPLTVRLGAAAAITGRALEAGGEPIADAFVTINYAHKSAREIERFVGPEHPAVKTDAEGRFEVGNIVPGERFALDVRQDKSYFRANLTDEQRQLKAGQKLELGEMTMKQLR